jgi:hypothetical protein
MARECSFHTVCLIFATRHCFNAIQKWRCCCNFEMTLWAVHGEGHAAELVWYAQLRRPRFPPDNLNHVPLRLPQTS